MRKDIQDIIDNYIKSFNIYISNNEGNYDSNALENIVDKLIEELKSVLNENHVIRNFQYRDQIIELNVVYHLLDELGIRVSNEMFKDANIGKNKADVKTRLFMMFVKTIGEIVYLLEGGYASCAMSRIRYVYEIGVLLEFINKNNNEFAKRFFYISEKSRIDMAKELGDLELVKSIKNEKKGVISADKYIKNYSWAKSITKKEKSTFKELAYLSEYKDKYAIYIESCWYVHGDIYGSLVSLDRYKDEPINTWNTEPSKYGTEKVIKYTFSMLYNITKDYFENIVPSLSLLNMMCISRIVKEIYK
ncbi:MAG: DUF5677 domain-containing protein [Clostridium sp.]|uniref:DUF5677 domain-containing protein n=1 Tax=Clostridium sp. TaxID=1506 RepID=UPI00290A4C05|nr:DUF5677 domain-containing protein [Clostridium sp.]MDU5211424.1 DUF5677 domain-containing protein [Clostridium sp.]MDU6763221.1 DUF5677 domain-containing protein [Clostridium sp.]